jgi:hypothetical protein
MNIGILNWIAIFLVIIAIIISLWGWILWWKLTKELFELIKQKEKTA